VTDSNGERIESTEEGPRSIKHSELRLRADQHFLPDSVEVSPTSREAFVLFCCQRRFGQRASHPGPPNEVDAPSNDRARPVRRPGRVCDVATCERDAAAGKSCFLRFHAPGPLSTDPSPVLGALVPRFKALVCTFKAIITTFPLSGGAGKDWCFPFSSPGRCLASSSPGSASLDFCQPLDVSHSSIRLQSPTQRGWNSSPALEDDGTARHVVVSPTPRRSPRLYPRMHPQVHLRRLAASTQGQLTFQRPHYS
jgi:hypothetical protein